MIDVSQLMQKFCDVGAAAVSRYAAVSGDSHFHMPEYFMASFILDHLGSDVTATLEMNFSTLVEWNDDARKHHGLPKHSPDDRALLLAEQLGGRRVDMVLFEGEEERKAKDLQDFFALVEVKRGWIDAASVTGKISDRDRLLMLLDRIDTCKWGIACGWIQQNHRDWQKAETEKTSDRWFETEFHLQDYDAPLYFGARLLARGSDEDRVRRLLAKMPQSPRGEGN